VQETQHFMVCQRPPASGRAILLHTFNEATVDEDLSSIITTELGPLGIVASSEEWSNALCAIVASTCPSTAECSHCDGAHLDLPAIWRQYCLNTLRRLRPLLADPQTISSAPLSHIVQFAAVYRRIMDHCTGTSLLDVGSSLGFLPVLVAEEFDGMSVVGCDGRQDAVACATDLAQATSTGNITFVVRDVLAPDFSELGAFDTVTAVHLLEHLTEEQLATALGNMLRVTTRRLIVAVPYEAHVQALHGHEQAFTPEKLHLWGAWCVETLGGGQFWCEDVSGGLLVVDRSGAGARPAPPADRTAAG
jgi:Methyltransferase domain